MVLTIDDLKEYSRMSVTEKHGERGKEIRAELDMRMRWMPIKWRRLIRCRFILGYSEQRTAMEINVHKRTVGRWTREIAEYLEDTDKYLNEIT